MFLLRGLQVRILLGSPLNPFEMLGFFETAFTYCLERRPNETAANRPKPQKSPGKSPGLISQGETCAALASQVPA